MIATPPPAVQVWDVDDATYYSDYSAVSFSMLKVARQSLPLYRRLFVTREQRPEPPTLAMRVGSAVHCLCLEPEAFSDRFLEVDGRTKAGKAATAAWLADEKSNPVPLSPDAMQEAVALADAIKAHPLTGQLLTAPGFVERPLRRQDAETGLWLKSKMDKVIAPGVLTENPLIVEIKTAMDPRPYVIRNGEQRPGPFAWTVLDADYHLQLANYTETIGSLFGVEAVDWVWVVVGKNTAREVWTIDGADFLVDGQRAWRTSLNELASAYAADRWDMPGQTTFYKMQVPRRGVAHHEYNETTLPANGDDHAFPEFDDLVS